MKSSTVVILIVAAVVLLIALIIGGMWLSATNREVSLRNAAAAQEKANEATFDSMWKIVQGQAEVASEYRDAFKDVYKDIITGRYKDSNLLFKFIKEHNPKFDVSLYKKVTTSIEAERKRFETGQKKLIDLKREHDDLRGRWPSSMFVGGRPELTITVVTSDKTEDAFRTGKDEPGPVFPKRK